MAISVMIVVGKAKEMVPMLVEKAATLRVGPSLDDPTADLGPVITAADPVRVLVLTSLQK